MSETMTIIFGVLSFTTVLMCPFIINKLTKYKLELEKMRLEADVRKEEIRCRNQLELDKYMNGVPGYGSAAAKQHTDLEGENLAETGVMFEGTRSGKQMDNSAETTGNGGRERLKY
jgi:hypothetical protein